MQGEYHSRVLPDVVHFMQLTDLGEESADGLLRAASASNLHWRHIAPSHIEPIGSRLSWIPRDQSPRRGRRAEAPRCAAPTHHEPPPRLETPPPRTLPLEELARHELVRPHLKYASVGVSRVSRGRRWPEGELLDDLVLPGDEVGEEGGGEGLELLDYVKRVSAAQDAGREWRTNRRHEVASRRENNGLREAHTATGTSSEIIWVLGAERTRGR
jgi:hypothetical protein